MNSIMASADWLNGWSRVTQYGLLCVCVCEESHVDERRVKTLYFELLTLGLAGHYIWRSRLKVLC